VSAGIVTAGAGAVALSAALREGTREEHDRAERSPFVEDLLSGRLGIPAYVDLAVQQLAIYTALESAGVHLVAADDAAAALVLPELERVPTIERDLSDLLGTDWAERVRFLPATKRYAERLRGCGADGVLYAAHAYTRYLGDLSGGQVIKRMVQRHYGLEHGLAFYDFPEIDRIKPFKDVYRERLDALELDEPQRARAVAEAQVAFSLNRAMFVELGEVHRAS